jgi:uncharacterized protein (DUF488 family)
VSTPIFTIGHSTHSAERFSELLQQHKIQFVVDVRTTPYSRRVPQFNKNSLRERLVEAYGIRYAHMPEEFGARKLDPDLLDADQRVDFDRVRSSEAFQRGVTRLKNGAIQGHRIALLCAEADPFECHRFSLISYQLVREDLLVKHILRDGSLIDNSELERRLRTRYGSDPQVDIFGPLASTGSQLELAYRSRGREVAYTVTGAER